MSCPRGCCESYREHLDSVRLGVTSPRMQQDRTVERDMDAYKRLRSNGVQPKGIEGSAELERGASTTHEIEHRNIITDPKLRRRVTTAFEQAAPPTTSPDAT